MRFAPSTRFNHVMYKIYRQDLLTWSSGVEWGRCARMIKYIVNVLLFVIKHQLKIRIQLLYKTIGARARVQPPLM